jgi:hypothetical protein
MRSVRQSLRLAGGAFSVVVFVLGAAEGGAPPDEAQPSARGSNDLKLSRPRVRKVAEAADGALIDNIERQARLAEGFLRNEVRKGLNKAQALMGVDPQRAEDNLKLLLDKASRSTDIANDVRAQLVEQIEAAERTAHRRAQAQAERRLRDEQAAAENEARERIHRELTLQEQKVDQLMSRFDALLGEGRYRDAEAVADVAEEIEPGQPGLRGAELTARMTGNTTDMNAVRDIRQTGFVDTTYQVELSHVPAPGEPPIVYPATEVWQLLTERRKKYKAVDLRSHSASETKILAALDDQTDLDFSEQPLSEVIDYLKQRHDIELQLDARALSDAGLSSDVPVTRNVKGITLRSALKLLLGEMDLTYVIRNEVLLITTKTEADNMVSTRVYPVGDLVVPIASPRGGGTGGMGGMFGGGGGTGGMTGGMGGMGMGMGGMGMGMGGMGMGGMGMGGMGMGLGGGMF